jgi:hypothetical protein
MGQVKIKKNEQFISAPKKLLESHAYRALHWSARSLFWDIRSKYNGYNNGDLNASLANLRSAGWTSSATLTKCLRQLEAVGLIQKTRKTVGVENGSKMCNLYRFTDLQVFDVPKHGIKAMRDTNDYVFIKSGKEAQELVKKACTGTKKVTIQSVNRDDSKYEPTTSANDSISEKKVS